MSKAELIKELHNFGNVCGNRWAHEAASVIRKQDEAIKLALEALEIASNINLVGAAYSTKAIGNGFQKIEAAIAKLKEVQG